MVGWLIVRLKDENIVLPVADTLGAEGGSVYTYIFIIDNHNRLLLPFQDYIHRSGVLI